MIGKTIWAFGIVAWYAIRFRFERKAKRVPIVWSGRSLVERTGLASATAGLGIVPGFYVLADLPRWASYPASTWLVTLGAITYICSLWLFWRSHKDLGKNWSITLEIRSQHQVIRHGVYSRIRHPMYAAFWLMGFGQALLLPNWVAGLAGPVGFGLLYFMRVDKEERMLVKTFGDEYLTYMTHTKRIIPFIH